MPIDARIPMGFQPIQVEPPMNNLMRFMQLKGMQQDQADRAQRNRLMDLQIQQAQQEQAAALAQRERQRAAIASLPSPVMQSSMRALAGGGGPTTANAQRIQPVDPRAQAMHTLFQAGMVKPEDYVSTLDPNFGRPEVARTVEVDDGKGGKATMQVDKFGRPVGQALPAYIAPVQVNQGGQVTFARPQAGVSLPISMSPAERDASARGWAGVQVQRAAEARQALPQFNADVGGFVDTRNQRVTPAAGAGAGKPLTEGQAKAVLFGNRALAAHQLLGELEGKGVTQPGMIKRSAETLGQIAGLGTSFGDVLGSTAGTLTNWTQSTEQQRVDQAQRDFINAVLRRESGAVISPEEFDNARKQYFPQPGDSEQVIRQKATARELAIRGILAEAPANRRELPQVQGVQSAPRGATVDWGSLK